MLVLIAIALVAIIIMAIQQGSIHRHYKTELQGKIMEIQGMESVLDSVKNQIPDTVKIPNMVIKYIDTSQKQPPPVSIDSFLIYKIIHAHIGSKDTGDFEIYNRTYYDSLDNADLTVWYQANVTGKLNSLMFTGYRIKDNILPVKIIFRDKPVRIPREGVGINFATSVGTFWRDEVFYPSVGVGVTLTFKERHGLNFGYRRIGHGNMVELGYSIQLY